MKTFLIIAIVVASALVLFDMWALVMDLTVWNRPDLAPVEVLSAVITGIWIPFFAVNLRDA